MSETTFSLVNGAKIPKIGLGTWAITEEQGDAIEAALEIGYRHIDTATAYKNEHVIGNVLKKLLNSEKIKREDIFITTKLPREGVHPDKVEEFLKSSLEKLQLDYVDLYLIHFPMYVPNGSEPQPTDLIATWKKLEEQVDKGRTKAIGLSNFNKEQVARIISNSRIKPAANQVELHVYLQQPELVKYCQDNEVIVISYLSLGNPGGNKVAVKEGRAAKVDFLKDPTVNSIAEKHNKSPAQILLKLLVQKKIAVIPKSITPSRMKENLNLFDFDLDSSDVSALEALDQGEIGRRVQFKLNKAYTDHPEYPFKNTK